MKNWTVSKPQGTKRKLHDAAAAPCDRKLTLLDLYVDAANRHAELTKRIGAWDHSGFQQNPERIGGRQKRLRKS
jgi:hypothetical protein